MAPIQIIKIGPKATFGREFIKVKNGSTTLAINLNEYNIIATIRPKTIPKLKEIIVSINVVNIWLNKFPSKNKSFNVFKTREGEEKIKLFMILKCVNMGNIKDAIGLGGIVGYTNGGIKIEECINKGIIEGKDKVSVGGIGGICIGGNILNCRNEGNVTALSCVSGIVGCCTSKSLTTYFEVQNSSNFGVITSTGYNKTTGYNTANSTYSKYNSCGTGGIIGYGTKTKVSDCYNAETLIKQADCNDLGGIVGSLRNGEITRCYNKGIINSNKTGYGIGGILGSGYYNIKVNNCYNSGNVIGYGSTGGIVGLTCQMDLRYCYNIGNIEGTWSLRWNCRVYWTI